MRKLPRHITVRIDRETAEAFHETMARRGQTASAYLRHVIVGTVAPPGAVAPLPATRKAA